VAELVVHLDLLLVAGDDDGGGAQELSAAPLLGFRGRGGNGHGGRSYGYWAREREQGKLLILLSELVEAQHGHGARAERPRASLQRGG
jgi:hypothetical protein